MGKVLRIAKGLEMYYGDLCQTTIPALSEGKGKCVSILHIKYYAVKVY
jgi:hypothetical protein